MFNELLKKGIHFKWIKSYQRAFDDIKQYLLTPSVLIPPKDNVPFNLYILAIDFTLGVMLDQNNEQPIYYPSHTLVDYKLRCVYIEKVFFVVFFTVKKIINYMLNHTTYVIYRLDPLKYMMRKVYFNTHTT